jgi:hypothetical protein
MLRREGHAYVQGEAQRLEAAITERMSQGGSPNSGNGAALASLQEYTRRLECELGNCKEQNAEAVANLKGKITCAEEDLRTLF